MRIADLAFEFLLRDQGRHRVDHDDVDGVRLDQHFSDVHGLFAAARLTDQERFQLNADFFGPGGVEGMFGVDEGGDAAVALGMGHDMQGQRGFTAGFRPEDFDHATAGNALSAQGDVQRQTAGRDALDRRSGADAQRHNGPLAKFFLNLGQCIFQRGVVVKELGSAVCVACGFRRSLLSHELAGSFNWGSAENECT